MNDLSRQISRRGFLGVAGGAAALAGLAACAGTGSPGTPQESGGGGSANTIDFWSNHPGTSKEVEQKIITAFQSANPGITVKLTDAGKNYEEVAQKFNAALAGGTLPDIVVASDVTWFNFALNKQFAPLDDLLSAAGVKTDDYVDSLYNDYKFKDQHYALPYARSTPLFYYNKDLWKAAGLEDRGPKTWQELQEWAPKLKAAAGADKSVFEMPDGSNYLDWYFQNMVVGLRRRLLQGVDADVHRPEDRRGGPVPAGLRQGRLRQVQQDAGGRLRRRPRDVHRPVDRVARRHHQGGEVLGRDGVPAR